MGSQTKLIFSNLGCLFMLYHYSLFLVIFFGGLEDKKKIMCENKE